LFGYPTSRAAVIILNPLTGQLVEIPVPKPRPLPA
jgi:hypothetical protein